jgi:MFS transporter, PHS family, inorganic phosphate transporter
VRTTAHGIAAALGKVGGFFGVFLVPYLMQWRGLAAAIASLAGFLVTAFMLPETKGKALKSC